MADSLNVVTVRIEDVCAVVVGVVLRSETRRTVVAAARGERRGVKRIDGCAVWRGEGDVQCRRFAFRDEEVNASRRTKADCALDFGPLDAERCERSLVEPAACRHVTDRDGEVV